MWGVPRNPRSALHNRTMLPLLATLILRQSVDHDLIYYKAGGAAFTMDEFRPAKPNGMAVLFMVSGGWVSDHKNINALLAGPFNAKGITLFEVVPGSQPRYKIPEMEVMVSQAVRYVRANATKLGVSPTKIGIVGMSSGGHLSLMSGAIANLGKPDAPDPVDRVSSRPDAIVAFAPPTDMANFGGPGRMPWNEDKYKVFLPAFPVAPDDAAGLAQSAKVLSPITYVTSAFPPTLLIHGDKDDLVPIQQSQVMDAALTKAGVEHKFVVVAGAGHDGGVILGGMAAMFDWFEKELGKG